MANNNIKLHNATDIAKHFLPKCPNLKNYLEILQRNNNIEINAVGKRFKYPHSVQINRLNSYYGLVMDIFIRKLLTNRFCIKFNDDYTEIILKNVGVYFTDNVKRKIQPYDLLTHYKIAQNPNTRGLDILESIKKVALATSVYFKDGLPKIDVETDMNNLLEIKKYIEKLPYARVEIKSQIDCEYFKGNADIIFDENVLYEIKNIQKFSTRHFYKLILYAFGYFKKTGGVIKVFKIYNPLLGEEYLLTLDVDFTHLEKILKQDISKLQAGNF